MKKTVTVICLFFGIFLSVFAQNPAEPTSKASVARLEKDIPKLMKEADIPGMSIAIIRNGKMVWSNVFGVINTGTKKPVTPQTVFEAASLSKPVFAYGVLKLVDEGKLDLDTPLTKYLGNNYDVVDDPRINLITARHVLSHTSGFPNWRDNDRTKNLLIHFTPGEKFSYSGEGIVYLSRVVEKITGLSFEDFMQQMVLQPLGMTSSSYIWQDRYDSLKAYRHNAIVAISGRIQPDSGYTGAVKEHGNAAASLSTNAVDYSKFIIAVLNGAGLKKSTWQAMLTPQIRINPKYPQLAWGLGIGLETMPGGEYCWHWGDNGDGKAFIVASTAKKDAVVYFANSANGLSITKDILDDAIGGDHPSLKHLDYERYDAPSRRLLKSILAQGAKQALPVYLEERRKDTSLKISEEAINTLGYLLLRMQRTDDAVVVFTQNTIDFPESWNAWDSLAEWYMNKGDKETAIKYYEKSMQLNPANENGEKMLKKLRS